jgi:sugar lactone lactonase YvrE
MATESRVVTEGIAFGESPRWHGGRLWFSDWGAGRVYSLDADEALVLEAEVESFPLCIDFLPDGRLLLVSSANQKVLRREADGTLSVHADLAPISTKPWNDITVDARGRAYVNTIGFAFGEEDPAPGSVVLVEPDGAVRVVAEDLSFPNGMALIDGGSTLVVAESYAEQLTAFDVADDGALSGRRVWAATPGDHPDGICVDATGAIWYADVGNQRCVRLAEGGVLFDAVSLDRGAFACALSDGEEPTLYVVGQNWGGEDDGPSGQVVAFPAPAPAAI